MSGAGDESRINMLARIVINGSKQEFPKVERQLYELFYILFGRDDDDNPGKIEVWLRHLNRSSDFPAYRLRDILQATALTFFEKLKKIKFTIRKVETY